VLEKKVIRVFEEKQRKRRANSNRVVRRSNETENCNGNIHVSKERERGREREREIHQSVFLRARSLFPSLSFSLLLFTTLFLSLSNFK